MLMLAGLTFPIFTFIIAQQAVHPKKGGISQCGHQNSGFVLCLTAKKVAEV